jgi:hypothetical protein
MIKRLATLARRRTGRPSSGQALAEFAMVIPVFLTLVIAMFEFTFLFTAYVEVGFASHEGVQVAAAYGDAIGTDCAVIDRVRNDLGAPADPNKITSIDIFWVDTSTPNGSPVAGAENLWVYDGVSHNCTKPDGTVITQPFKQTNNGYPETSRCNANLGIGCVSGRTTVDTIAVKITYQYAWVTPFPALIGGSGSGPQMQELTIMRLEPTQ